MLHRRLQSEHLKSRNDWSKLIAVVSLTSHELEIVAFVFETFLADDWEHVSTLNGPQWSTGGRIQQASFPLLGTVVHSNIKQVQGYQLVFRKVGARDIPRLCYKYVVHSGDPKARSKRRLPQFLPSRIFTYPEIPPSIDSSRDSATTAD